MNRRTQLASRLMSGALFCFALSLTATVGLGQTKWVAKSAKLVAIKAGHVVTGTGQTMKDATILIRDGKIAAIGQSLTLTADTRVVDCSESWIFPGMIDCMSKASMPNDLKEPRDAVDLDNKPSVALVPNHRDFKMLAHAGITSVVVMPEADGVVSGVAAVVKTDGSARRVMEKGPVAMALTGSTQKSTRFPTSLMGSFRLLGQTLAKPSQKILQEVADNKRAAIVRADTEAEIRAFLRLAKSLKLKCALATDGSIRRVLNDVDQPLLVTMPALSLSSPLRDQLLPGLLRKKSHVVAFHVSAPGRAAADLRYSAALAVKMGLDRASGIQSITRSPAVVAGALSRIGTLEKGKDADFIVLSGHLLDLSASIQETWIDGRRVFKNKMMKNEVSR